jgi:hypothetical protein
MNVTGEEPPNRFVRRTVTRPTIVLRPRIDCNKEPVSDRWKSGVVASDNARGFSLERSPGSSERIAGYVDI